MTLTWEAEQKKTQDEELAAALQLSGAATKNLSLEELHRRACLWYYRWDQVTSVHREDLATIATLQEENHQLQTTLTEQTAALQALTAASTSNPSSAATSHHQPRRRLKTRAQVVNGIRGVIRNMQNGTLTPNDARAQLYAFQTLLVAMQAGQTTPKPTVTAVIQAGTYDPEST